MNDPSRIEFLPTLLGFAVMSPLASFAVIWLFGPYMGKAGKGAGHVATMAILTSAVLSFVSLGMWLTQHTPSPYHRDHGDHALAPPVEAAPATLAAGSMSLLPVAYQPPPAGESTEPPAGESDHADDGHANAGHADDGHDDGHHDEAVAPYTGVIWDLGRFGDMRVSISYYIDSLTITMFCMVTLIASCIHFYATGYMHDELHDVTDHEVQLSGGEHLHRPGRYPRFFQYLSLFCFSMLGLVYAGNIAMVFVFWELVGICSYFLIGFYVERKSASTAANKAFIVNRVGDFGMIIGLMVLWAGIGTFAFGDTEVTAEDGTTHVERGLFSTVRPPERDHAWTIPAGMARLSARDELRPVLAQALADDPEHLEEAVAARMQQLQAEASESGSLPYGYWLMIIAGAGIFCGCVGKSAQFPLHTWLPDAMEGPTPVSALVHSATMVAAGVYLVGRFYPVFAPEVLLLIAVVGAITLFMAATIAITATDIKRVLAYSTISQLGYMMLALGVGGWIAGLMHLITHAFFKSLLFMCSGSVIHAVHTNEMPLMGGLRKKMPYTATTMLIGCLAIAGAGVPFVVGFSGYYSKDAILEQAFSLGLNNSSLAWAFFAVAAGGAAITAFYMFRLWYLTFAGKPRDAHRYDHAHESPKVMVVPLLVLSVFAIVVAWDFWHAIRGAVLLLVVGLVLLAAQWVIRRTRGAADGLPGRSFYWGIVAASLAITLTAMLWQMTLGDRNSWETNVTLSTLLQQSHAAGIKEGDAFSGPLTAMIWPNEYDGHVPEVYVPATLIAFSTAAFGILLATVFYCWNKLSADEVRRQFAPVYTFLINKWYFDELYEVVFVRPTFVIAAAASWVDKQLLDRLIDGTARCTRGFARWWAWIADRVVVDGAVDGVAAACYRVGSSLRQVQTGSVRQYVMFIALGLVMVFLIISMFRGISFAG